LLLIRSAPLPALLPYTTLFRSEAVLVHALQALGIRSGTLAFLQCTAPLILPEDIDGTLALLEEADTAFTATPWHGFPWVVESGPDRKSTRLNSSHVKISYAVFC